MLKEIIAAVGYCIAAAIFYTGYVISGNLISGSLTARTREEIEARKRGKKA